MRRLFTFGNLFPVAIIVASSLVRYYTIHASHWHCHYNFLYDPAYELVQNGQIPLSFSVGVPLLVSYGPALIYLFAPFLLVFKKMEALIYFSIVLEAAAIFLVYRIGKDFYSRAVGIMACLLYSLSYFVVTSAGDFSNGYLQSPFFLLFIYSLLKLKISLNPRYAVLFFLASAILLQTHLSAFIIIPVLAIVVFQRSKREAGYKWVGLVLLALSFVPYIIYCLERDPGIFRIYSDRLLIELKETAFRGKARWDHFGEIAQIFLGWDKAIYGWNKAIFLFYLFGIFSTFSGALRDIVNLRKTSWTREIILAALLSFSMAFLLIHGRGGFYHYVNINILMIIMLSSTLGNLWRPDVKDGFGRIQGYRKLGALTMFILILAVNANASYTFYRPDEVDSGKYLRWRNVASYASLKEAAGRIVEMEEKQSKQEADRAKFSPVLLETRVIYWKDHRIDPIEGCSCFYRLLRESFHESSEELVILKPNEYLLISEGPLEERATGSAEKNETRKVTVTKHRSMIDHGSCRFSSEYQAGWWLPEFNDDHWMPGRLPFWVDVESWTEDEINRVTPQEKGSEKGEEEKLNGILWDEWGGKVLRISDFYFRFVLHEEDPLNRYRLYICSLAEKSEHLEDLRLYVNGREVDRDRFSKQDDSKIRVENLQPWLMKGPNLIAIKLRVYRTDDFLLILDLENAV